MSRVVLVAAFFMAGCLVPGPAGVPDAPPNEAPDEIEEPVAAGDAHPVDRDAGADLMDRIEAAIDEALRRA